MSYQAHLDELGSERDQLVVSITAMIGQGQVSDDATAIVYALRELGLRIELAIREQRNA